MTPRRRRRMCQTCQAVFFSPSLLRYCSDACRVNRRQDGPERDCAHCTEPFVVRSANQTCCSSACRARLSEKTVSKAAGEDMERVLTDVVRRECAMPWERVGSLMWARP